MKLKMIPAVILASMSMAGVAQAQVSVYGLVDVGYKHVDNADDKVDYSMNSTTRVGVKGSTDVGSGIKGNFMLEAGDPQKSKTAPVTGTAPNVVATTKPFFDRQAWFGLSGGFGEVRIGTQDTVAFQTLIGFDQNGAANDTGPGSLAGVPTLGQNTVSGKDALMYISPAMGGLQARLSVTPKGNMDTTVDPKVKSSFSLGLSYATGPFAAGLVYESASTDDTASLKSNNFSGLGASYDFGVAKISGVYVNGGTVGTTQGGRGSLVGISAPIAGATVGIQYAKNSDTSDTGTEFFVNKEVLKNTTAYFEYGTQNPNAGNKTNLYSLGLIYAF